MRRAVAAAGLGAWLLALHAALNVQLMRRPEAPAATELVSVLVPARDEARRIGGCVSAVLAGRGVDFELLVGDDGSADGTADVARAAASGDPRVRVLTVPPPPPGWLGKPAACAHLAAAARGTVLAFVDADVTLAPGGLAGAVALLRGARLDLVSPYPRQLADGLGPRLVQPLLQWSWLSFLPLRLAERLPAPTLSAANGQLLVCDAGAYARVGGHAAVAGAVLDDVELARAFKRAGAKAAITDGSALATCRMYDDWPALREGYTKSLWTAYPPATFALLAWLYVLPPAAALLARGCRWLGLAGYAGGVAGRVVAARATGGRAADAAAHPVSVLVLAWLTARSRRARRAGTLTWKGRPVR